MPHPFDTIPGDIIHNWDSFSSGYRLKDQWLHRLKTDSAHDQHTWGQPSKAAQKSPGDFRPSQGFFGQLACNCFESFRRPSAEHALFRSSVNPQPKVTGLAHPSPNEQKNSSPCYRRGMVSPHSQISVRAVELRDHTVHVDGAPRIERTTILLGNTSTSEQ